MKTPLFVMLAVCSSCSLLFSTPDASTNSDASTEALPDAAPSINPVARIEVSEPKDCSTNTYGVDALNSTPGIGSTIEEFRWSITQDDDDLVPPMFGSPNEEIAPSRHVLGGMLGSFSLAPSLYSAPTLLSATGFDGDKFHQVYQVIDEPIPNVEYEVSFVAEAPVAGSFRVQMLEDGGDDTNLGLNQVLTPTVSPQPYSFTFMTNDNSTTPNARLRFAFNANGQFLIDNVSLRSKLDQEEILTNGAMGDGLDQWVVSFLEGADPTAVAIPYGFPDTILSLVVINSNGTASEAHEVTIQPPSCP